MREVAGPEIGSNGPDIAATTEVGEEQQQNLLLGPLSEMVMTQVMNQVMKLFMTLTFFLMISE